MSYRTTRFPPFLARAGEQVLVEAIPHGRPRPGDTDAAPAADGLRQLVREMAA